MRVECPVCKSKLHHVRKDEGSSVHEVGFDGEIETELQKQKINDYVICSKDETHKIPEALQEVVATAFLYHN